MINPISGMRRPFDVDYDLGVDSQESAARAQKSVDDYYELLSRADMQAGDSLDSYLDNVIATKADLAREDYIYSDSTEEATEDFFNNIGNIDTIHELQELGVDPEWQVDNSANLSNTLLANIIDTVIYSKLLHDKFPLGTTRFFLRPKLPGKGVADARTAKLMPLHERRQAIDFELSFYRLGQLKYKVDVRFNMHRNTVRMWVDRVEVSTIQFSIKNGVVGMAKGKLFNRAFLLKIQPLSERKNAARYVIGSWRTEKIVSSNNLEDGVWHHKIHKEQKKFRNKINQFENSRDENLVLQSVKIGEDQCMMLYRFAPGLIFPIFASGVIVNRNPEPTPIYLGTTQLL